MLLQTGRKLVEVETVLGSCIFKRSGGVAEDVGVFILGDTKDAICHFTAYAFARGSG